MIDNNCGLLLHKFRSPENDVVILQRVGEFLDSDDVMACERVCKIFFSVFQGPEIWSHLSRKEGIPLVEGEDHKRNRKRDFLILRSITFSGAMISQIIGEVRGPIPCISERVFNMLNAPDPFEPNKCMKDTYVFVVFPSEVTRFAGPQTPLDFDDKGNLVVVPADQVQNGKKLVISLTLTNIRLLCSYPLKGRENMPVFNMFDSGLLLNQHSASSDKTRVWFMARCIAEASRKLPYDAQAELVGEVGFGVTPIRIRVLSNVISILESGTCPDGRTPWSYVRGTNLDIVKWHDKPCYVVAGGYACFSGLRLGFREVSFTHQDLGVVPGIPADVSQPQQFGT